ncbi:MULTISPECIES: ligase-associated DNA damage response DEXH box helicase [Cyanophyceae]|uniref:ligase-associated DNA damage response DEXH box helicase n=1 Tax=Cyanophyceae TaxID=3028117 RepID=UPI001686F1AF|nr:MULTISPECIES: ligase-associated DNA damage response DEXH box helicase [Cyanophyceae]MBD1914731.1 ligase-associated DNA damage response DEXH box helicase [Phormidium sp. FACHB-77]MBD2030834.1 ligase-associated DNA damage response DEXH box helicase [Phormidium sp. FACHB-322]MBD2052433.1 ligase-associated DNA damage response DEXH box helicase [Leptolyngbya sp. FACHB-60]
MTVDPRLGAIAQYFTTRGWKPLTFQAETWAAYLAGRSGLVQVPTGSGKTYAAVMGAIAEMIATPPEGLQLLYITPLRALSRDIEQAIKAPIEAMGWGITVESRTGDTSSARKTKQLKNMPNILITTPESLAVMLSYKDGAKRFRNLQAVVLDEWHELMSSKRGTQAELCLGCLRSLQPTLRTWAISATLGNLEEAAQTAVGLSTEPVIIRSNLKRNTVIKSIRPESVDTFPWAGHLGLRMFETLVEALDIEKSTLIFTNTRNQAERWYQALNFALPEEADRIALHHGSIDVKEREAIEAGVKSGDIKWVVCTSSLDLGVDFQPVERVVQIGSAKNLARLLQRAGRSAHVPEGTSEVFFLPTNALELLEISAFRRGLELGDMETRRPQYKPYDVLVQHLVTLACGDGFEPQKTLENLRQTVAYADLTDEEYQWILDFIENGGQCLGAYPRYKKVVREDGLFKVDDAKLARIHRMGIGTITSNTPVKIVYTNRKEIGTVEESFVSRLKQGDVFFFAGRQLEYFQMKDMVLYVKGTRKKSTVTPTWSGGQLAISDTLSHHLRLEIERVRVLLSASANATLKPVAASASETRSSQSLAAETPSAIPLFEGSTRDSQAIANDEILTITPILEAQQRLSTLPSADELLVESCKTREGQHLYVFPFEGRFVHEGLGFLWGYRFAKQKTATFTISINDYGFEILGPQGYPYQDLFSSDFFSLENLEDDIRASLNISELTQRKFRGVAQVAGLVFKGYPGSRKTSSQLQVSTSLLYEVFTKYEPDNLLLKQAEREVLQDQLETHRLAKTLSRLDRRSVVWKDTQRPSPLAFPLLVERLNSRMSNETLLERIQRMKEQWDRK